MTELTRLGDRSNPIILAYWSASWSPNNEAIALILRTRQGAYAPAILYPSEGRTVVVEGEWLRVSDTGYPFLFWTAGAERLVLGQPAERSLRILDSDLAEAGRIGFPDSIRNLSDGRAYGNSFLFQASHPESVWRLDLDTEKWKRIW